MRFLYGVILGFLLFSVGFTLFFYPSVKESWRNQGINEGSLSTQLEIFTKLESEFDQIKYQDDHELLFQVKTSAVYIIENKNGKTLGIIK